MNYVSVYVSFKFYLDLITFCYCDKYHMGISNLYQECVSSVDNHIHQVYWVNLGVTDEFL